MDRDEGEEKMRIEFRAIHQYPETHLYPLSDNAKALLHFARRASILPTEIKDISAMGFRVIINGHVREYEQMMNAHNIHYQRNGQMIESDGSQNE